MLSIGRDEEEKGDEIEVKKVEAKEKLEKPTLTYSEVAKKSKSPKDTWNSWVIRAVLESGPTIEVGMVDNEPKKQLRKSGSGKITIDSGAGESVCPLDMVPEEPLRKTAKNEMTYRAAGGQKPTNKGEKKDQIQVRPKT